MLETRSPDGYAALVIRYVVDPFPTDEQLKALWLAAWGNPGPVSFGGILSRSLAHVGAYADGELVGFVNLASDGGVHAFLLDTCVHPHWRGRGIGRGLVAHAVGRARERGIEWLHVDFEPHLLGFYRGCGFGETQAGLMRLARD